MVGFRDGAIMAHLGPHDMRHAIGYALNWPERAPLPVERLDLARLAQLTFQAPDEARFPALRLAREVMAAGGLSGAVFNAAKEVALDHFMDHALGFTDMAVVVEQVLAQLSAAAPAGNALPTLEDVLAMDHLARVKAREAVRLRQSKG
jgi:1-deoxy-D-xylulose-5-phosphate reductoisomerase